MALVVSVSLTESCPRMILSKDSFESFNSTLHVIKKGNLGPEMSSDLGQSDTAA